VTSVSAQKHAEEGRGDSPSITNIKMCLGTELHLLAANRQTSGRKWHNGPPAAAIIFISLVAAAAVRGGLLCCSRASADGVADRSQQPARGQNHPRAVAVSQVESHGNRNAAVWCVGADPRDARRRRRCGEVVPRGAASSQQHAHGYGPRRGGSSCRLY
jgi:hypothetical protein